MTGDTSFLACGPVSLNKHSTLHSPWGAEPPVHPQLPRSPDQRLVHSEEPISKPHSIPHNFLSVCDPIFPTFQLWTNA